MKFKKNTKALRSMSGFTLLEVIIAISIVAVISVLAIPSMGDFLERRQMNARVENLADLFSAARMQALSEGNNTRVCWNSTGADVTESGHTIADGEAAIIDNAGKLVRLRQIYTDDGFMDDSLGTDCLGFDGAGRSTAGAVVTMAVCKDNNNTEGMMMVSVGLMGRASIDRAPASPPTSMNCR